MPFDIKLALASGALHEAGPIRKMMAHSDVTLKNTGKTLIIDHANINAVSVGLLLAGHDV